MGVGTSRGGGRKATGSTCRSEDGPRETGMGWVGKGLPEGCGGWHGGPGYCRFSTLLSREVVADPACPLLILLIPFFPADHTPALLRAAVGSAPSGRWYLS